MSYEYPDVRFGHSAVVSHERQAELHMEAAAKALEMAERARQIRARFGLNEDYPDETVLMFKRNFGGSTDYTYVAIKVRGYWYLSKANGNSKYTFELLLAEFLAHAIEVWIASEWKEI